MHSIDVGIPDTSMQCVWGWEDVWMMKLCNRIMFSFYLGLPHMHTQTCVYTLTYAQHPHTLGMHTPTTPPLPTHTHMHRTSYFLPQTVSRLTREENQLAHMIGNISLTTSSSRQRTPRLARTMFPLSRRHHPRTPRWVNCVYMNWKKNVHTVQSTFTVLRIRSIVRLFCVGLNFSYLALCFKIRKF